MDSFLGIGLPELVVILLLAGVVMGPHRIRQVARTLGRFVAQMQAISRQFTRQLNAELDAMDAAEVRGALEDVKQLRQEMADLRRQVRSIPGEVVSEGRKVVEEGERAFKPRSAVSPEVPADGEKTSPPSATRIPRPVEVADDPE